jgi:hypothetical protein
MNFYGTFMEPLSAIGPPVTWAVPFVVAPVDDVLPHDPLVIEGTAAVRLLQAVLEINPSAVV